MDYLKEKSSTENLLEEIIDQRVSVWLQDIITLSESLMKLMFKDIPKKSNNKSITVAKVENAFLQRDEQTYTAATPKACVKISNIIVDAMLDSSTEVNIITRSLADMARLTV